MEQRAIELASCQDGPVSPRPRRPGDPEPAGAAARPRVRTPSSDVEQALLDAAERVLVRDGVAGVTVRAVASEAGVAPMGVYNRFGSKDGLVAAMVIRGFELLREAIAVPEAAAEPDPLLQLKAAGRAYRRFGLEHPQHYHLIFGSPAAGETREADPDVLAAGTAAFEALVGHVEHAMNAGAIPAGDAVDVAQQVWSAVHGAVSLELADRVGTPDPAATYDRLLDLVNAGLAAGP
jgi:AcrR family transcriptional regulator